MTHRDGTGWLRREDSNLRMQDYNATDGASAMILVLPMRQVLVVPPYIVFQLSSGISSQAAR